MSPVIGKSDGGAFVDNLYVGTSGRVADELMDMDKIPVHPQERPDDTFGTGFYTTTKVSIAEDNAERAVNPRDARRGFEELKVLRVRIDEERNVLNAAESFGHQRGTIRPINRPTWHFDLQEWYLDRVKEAKVWETTTTDKSKEEILQRAEGEIDPISGAFDRFQWYKTVTDWAFDTGKNIIYWTDSSVVAKPGTEATFIDYSTPQID